MCIRVCACVHVCVCASQQFFPPFRRETEEVLMLHVREQELWRKGCQITSFPFGGGWLSMEVRVCVGGVGGCRTHLLQAPLERLSVWRGFYVALDEPKRPPCLIINLSWLEIFASESNWWYKSADSAAYLRSTTQNRGPQRSSLIHASAGSKS